MLRIRIIYIFLIVSNVLIFPLKLRNCAPQPSKATTDGFIYILL